MAPTTVQVLRAPRRAASASEDHQQQTPVPFSRGAQTRTTFHSHYQHAGPMRHYLRRRYCWWWWWWWWSGARTNRTTTTRVSSSDPSSQSPVFILPFFPSSSFFRFRACIPMVPCCESVCDRGTLATLFPSSQTPDCPLACCYRDTAKIPISRLAPRTPARPVGVLENAHPLLAITHWHRRSRTCTPSDIPRPQCYLNRDRVSPPVPVIFAESSVSVRLQSL